ncbi:MAG TPA: MG2 domain-containing protein, partial [Myxococcales bacterium]
MKRTLAAACLLLWAACHKPSEETRRKVSEPPPPPPLQLPKGKEGEEGFRVVAGRPQGMLLPAAHPTITFSEPVVSLATLEQGDSAKGLQIQPPIKGRWRWLGSASVEFVNEEPFPPSTAFHLVVPQGFRNLQGEALEKGWQLDFTTPTPAVTSAEPSGWLCKWSTPRQHFEIIVNQPLATPEKYFFFEVGEQKKMVRAQIVKSISVAGEKPELPPGMRRRRDAVAPPQMGDVDLRTRYEIAPLEDLPPATPFAVGLDGEARGAQGELRAGVEWRAKCQTMGPMRVEKIARCFGEQEHCSHGPISIEFSNPLGPVAELRKRLHLDPDAKIEWDESAGDDLGADLQGNRTRAVLFGKFRPGTAYRVRLDAGVKDGSGQEAPATESTVLMDDLLPSLYVGQTKALLESSGDGQLPAQVTNLAALEADLWAVTPAQMAPLEICSANCGFPARPPDAPLRLQLSYPRNEPHLQAVDLRAALGGRKTGFVVARLRAPGTEFADHPLRVLAQITDLAVHVKLGATASLVWVTSVTTARPIASAKVVAYGRDGKQLAEAATDSQGLAQFAGYGALLGAVPDDGPLLLVAASSGDDTGYSVTTGYWDESVPIEVGGRDFEVLKGRPLGILFTDRGIYRPGDGVHVKGILRDQRAGELQTPAGSVHVKVSDPQGKEIAEEKVALSKYGTFTLDVAVPKEAKLGSFSVTAFDGERRPSASASFLVAEYRAPQFRVEVRAPAAELTAGDELKATVIARYLFGGAMDRAQATWSVQRSSDDFSPPRNDAFRFGRQTWSWDDGAPARDNGLFASGQGEIGREGTLQISAGKVEALADRATRFTVEAEVADVSRQRVAGRAAVLMHPAAYYVGLGAPSLFTKAGEELKLLVIAAKPDGERVTASVHVTALLRSWHSLRKRGLNGIYETISEPVEEKAAECAIATGREPVECKLMLQKPGFYNLRAESKDSAGRLALTTASVYALGSGFAAWQENDSPKIEVVPDKLSYQPGETAHLLVKSPFASCRALVSVEREGVSEARVLELSGTAATIDVPVREEHAPNVFVGVLLQRARVPQGGGEAGDDPGRPAIRIGYAELKVGTAVKKLAVSVSTAKSEYRPREKVAVDIAVRDSRGNPQRAEVQLYAVDEAVLRLTSYQLPDPLEAMYPRHLLAISVGEPMPRLVRRQKFGEKGEVQPGGGGGLGPPGDVRSKFVTTVLWRTLETGADGKARAELELPDNLTTFRIMAVAATDGDRFGGGQSEIRVSLPLLVLPSLPRFARVGDELEAGVAVHSSKQLEVEVKAEISGGLALAEGAAKKITIEAGVAKEVRFKLRGVSPGKATLRFRASAEGLSDAVEQTIPVQLPVETEAVAVAGSTSGEMTEGLLPPKGVRQDTGGLDLQLSSTALGGLEDAMQQLRDYPYGCIEQLSSRLVPFVATREVQRVFGVPQPAGADAVVTDTIARIEHLQAPSGGFLYWPNAECPYAWPSVYATLALHRANELGYPVRKEVLARAKKFLAQKAAGESNCRGDSVGSETRIFALSVLARMGDPRPSYYDELYAEKDKLPLFAKALLADAIVLGKGKRPRAEALLQEIFDAAKETPRDLHFEESSTGSYAPLLSSDTRTTGMVLQTLVDMKPAHPFVAKIARYLSSVRKGGAYRNTQEAAYSLMGLAEVVRVKEREAPDFVARVLLGGKELLAQEFRKRSLDVVSRSVPMKTLPSSALPLEFKVDGAGSLYYTALLRYAPEKMPREARSEGIFVQRW